MYTLIERVMSAVIIGIDGGMGRWLKKHLESIDYKVSGFDIRNYNDLSIIKKANLVIISVPIGVTVEVIKFAIKYMNYNATLMEIASLKTGIHNELIEASKKGFSTLCVHPMFGPSITSLEEKTVAVIPVSDIESEINQTKTLFPGASIVMVNPLDHDRLMSLILSLPYLVNLALAGTMRDDDLGLLKKLSGTTFALQYTLIQSVAAEGSNLVSSLLKENRSLRELYVKFIENLTMIMQTTDSLEEFSQIHREIKIAMKQDEVYHRAHQVRQAAYDVIQPLLR
jgi:prephenate dehydrogenase